MGHPRRRRWTVEQKQQIVEETRAPGASVSLVARRYDINANLLFKWKRHDEAGQLGESLATPERAEFVPIGVVGRTCDGGPALLARCRMPSTGSRIAAGPKVKPADRRASRLGRV